VSDPRDQLQASLSARYAVERELGRGGMATVYLAQDLKHDRRVAIKFLRPEVAAEVGTERFLREIRVAAQLHHPHILPLYDSGAVEAGESEGGPKARPYYVMPYVEGESLRARLTREGHLPLEDALQITREVAEALDYAHRHNIVHRDIKPENILLEEGHALVMDFGIARAITVAGQEQLTAVGLLVGTPAYMSPEQVSGEAALDGRSDIYSLACVFYEMLAGEPPFSGTSQQAILVRRLIDRPRRLSDLRPEVGDAVGAATDRALSRAPGDRFPTAAAFAEALGLAGAGLGSGARPHPLVAGPVAAERLSIAVLPFVNLSPDPENEYFSDGMTEELTTALMRVPGLRVASRSSAFAFKGKDVGALAIGERLSVDSLVEGTVRKVGTRIRLTAQLVDAAGGYQRWSETYDRTLEDVFAVQDELARAIAGTLANKFVGSASGPLVKPSTGSLEAYTLYLRGRHAASRRTVEGLRAGIEYFDQAIAHDSAYAAAHAELAACWTLRGFEEFGDLPPHEAMPKAKAAASRALEIDPLLAEAHGWLAVVAALYDWDWAAAEARFRRAIELGPEHSMAHVWYALFLGAMGRHEESIRIILRAEALDPLSPPIHLCVGRCYSYAGEYEKALVQFRATRDMEPRHGLAYASIGRALCGKGMYREAAAELEAGISVAGPSPVMLMVAGYAYGRSGARDKALDTLKALRQEASRRYVSPMCEAAILVGIGELDEAFTLYDLAYQQRSGYFMFLRVFPTREYPIRSDPRFVALLQQLHLNF
jgi:TolB-like protein/Tfp pilus assembly protein PilF/tRNA A-37 threonylcarbamoyl transferase component Bud32